MNSITMNRPARAMCLLAGLLLAPACTEAPSPMEPVVDEPAFELTAAAASTAAGAALEDAIDRIVAGLPGSSAATGLGLALEDLLATLSGKTAAPMASAITRANAALDAYVASGNAAAGDAAELDVIALAIAAADATVQRDSHPSL